MTGLNLDAQLERLENAQLVRRADEEERAYLFKHTLTQETAYQSLLLKTRREIHRRVAESIEKLDAEHLDENAALLAQHYAEAEDPAKTLAYEARAGAVAARRYANAEALGHYTRALALTGPDTPAEVTRELYLSRGRVLELSGRYPEALANYDELEQVAQARSDRGLELEALMARATLRATPTPVYDGPQGRELLDRALALARERNDHAAESKGLWIMMLVSKFTFHPKEAVRYGEQSLQIARAYNLREQMAFTLNDLGVHGYLDVGQFRRGVESAMEARGLWEELDNQPMLADCWGTIALLHFNLGEFPEALRAAEEGQRISERIGNLWGQSYSRFAEGEIYVERGEAAHGMAIMEECIRLAEQAGFVAPLVWVRSNLAVIYAEFGAVECGIDLARWALATAESQLPLWRPLARAVLARLQLERGSGEAKETPSEEVSHGKIRHVIQTAIISVAVAVTVEHVQLALERSDPTAALALLDELVARIGQTDARLYLPNVLLLKARAQRACGERETALQVLQEARAAAEEIGSRRRLWRILAEWSEIEGEQGHGVAAENVNAQAREIVKYIAEHAPSDLRESFLNRPAVRKVNGDS